MNNQTERAAQPRTLTASKVCEGQVREAYQRGKVDGVTAYKAELIRTGKTIMSVGRVRQGEAAIERERAAQPPPPDWHDFVNLVYRLVPDGDVRGSIIGAAAKLAGSVDGVTPALDVERLARALGSIAHGKRLVPYADEIVAEYNRLAQV